MINEPTTPVAVPEPKKDTAPGIPSMFQDLLPVAALWFAVVVGVIFVALFFKESAPSAPRNTHANNAPLTEVKQ